jgi:phosphoenolpyruvate synthase/pyruvate phosphate dikinase
MLYNLADKGIKDPSLVGGKALGIYWLWNQGYPVPETWVLGTEAFDAAVQAAHIQGHISALESVTCGHQDWMATELALQALADLRQELATALRTTSLPEEVLACMERLPPAAYWAVRSSATVEDGDVHSFGGQFQSLLSVPGGPSLVDAIREVWVSTFGKVPLHYRAQHGTDMPRMAVILQPMPPITVRDRSGVVFSQSTLPGLSGVIIQATFGAGTTVVEGRGGEVKCVQGGGVTTYENTPARIMVTAPHGGIGAVVAQSGAVLSDREAMELASQIEAIAQTYGRPADVEFIWRPDEEPVFVQIRAVTA